MARPVTACTVPTFQVPPTLPTTDDPYPDNNFTVQQTTVNAAADVWVTKKDVPAETRFDKRFEPDEAMAGLEHRYEITFGNDSLSAARDVGITDELVRLSVGLEDADEVIAEVTGALDRTLAPLEVAS